MLIDGTFHFNHLGLSFLVLLIFYVCVVENNYSVWRILKRKGMSILGTFLLETEQNSRYVEEMYL